MINEKTDRPELLDGGWYSNVRTLEVVAEGAFVRLAPKALPVFSITCLNLIFCMFFGGVLWLCWDSAVVLAKTYIVIVGAITCIGCTLGIWWRFKCANAIGPVLVYNSHLNSISLPPHSLDFSCDDDIHIECITARPAGDYTNYTERLSELNFVATVDGEKMRWNLTKSCGTTSFSKLSKKLSESIPIDIRRVYA